MDGISAGASALTFLAFALQSVQSLYQTLSSYRDGPQQLRSLNSAIEALNTVLRQLQGCEVLANPEADHQNVRNLIEACNNDLLRYQKYLQKVLPNPEASKVKQAFKRFVPVLEEKTLTKIRTEIIYHCTVLDTQLSNLQLNKTIACERNTIELKNASTERKAHDTRQSALLQQTFTGVSTMSNNLDGLGNSITGQIRDAAESLMTRLEGIPDMSRQQNENICTLLNAIQAQISTQPTQIALQKSLPRSTGYDSAQSMEVPPEEESSTLATVIQRLSTLASEKEGTIHNEEADAIIDDLTALIPDAFKEHDSHRDSKGKKRKSAHDSDAESISYRDLKRLRGLITASGSLDVNTRQPRSSVIGKGNIIQQYNSEKIIMGNCTSTITLRKRRLKDPTGEENFMGKGERWIEYAMKIKAFLNDPQGSTVVTVQLLQTCFHSAMLSSNPFVAVGKTLPMDSPLFSLVWEGNVEGLQAFIADGQATLRDRNVHGAPLLHYATRQPKMCKFLLEHGADVDDSAQFGDYYFGVAVSMETDGIIEDDELRGRIIECRRLLLLAGADPTIASEKNENALESALYLGSSEFLRLVLDLGGAFVDLACCNPENDPALLILAESWGVGFDLDSFAMLLDRGAPIDGRNGKGETCLHLGILNAICPPEVSRSVQELDSLVLLIQKGADVLATDNRGQPASLFAYCPNLSHGFSDNFGGYRGDLWDAVLARSGYDISKFREEAVHPRRPRYTKHYTRMDFKQLWEGFELLCPYYHDPLVWPPATQSSQIFKARGGHCSYQGDGGVDVLDFDEGKFVSDHDRTANVTHHDAEVDRSKYAVEESESHEDLGKWKDKCEVCGLCPSVYSWCEVRSPCVV
ncbi:ankyrin [Viridothelium virens]|uniref:Ankyrin n=1 Tax=Viridothelium virens TaxID=1048519 RepID=A0A6A6GVR1_VIRVR|nr:ankyrin [Viridothelium virens]